MRQLEEAENKLVVPQTWDTHQHTALDVGEASLPNCRASNNALQGSSNSTTEQEDIIDDSLYHHDMVDSGSMSSDESAAAEEFPDSEEENPLEPLRSGPLPSFTALTRHRCDEPEVSRSPSPRLTHNSYNLEYDSEEDRDEPTSIDDKWPRIGSQYQADLDDLYGAELAEDNATLLWDPFTMSEDELSTLMDQCNVSDATFLAHQQSSAAPSNSQTLRNSNHSALTCSTSSESETLSLTNSKSSSEPASASSFLPLESMLQLIHDSGYVPSDTIANLKKLNTFGWSSKQSMFSVWSPSEMDSFESAMMTHPKRFVQISNIVGTRTTGECIEFYYSWKHTERHATWRRRIEQPFDEPLSHSLKVPSRKRKREVELPMDSSERLYLEALGSFDQPSHMLNIILDAPSMLAEDIPQSTYCEEEEEATPREVSEEELPSTDAPVSAETAEVAAPVAEFSRHILAAASPKRQKLVEADDPTLDHSIEGPSVPHTVDPTTIFSPIFTSPEHATLDFFMHF